MGLLIELNQTYQTNLSLGVDIVKCVIYDAVILYYITVELNEFIIALHLAT